MSRETVMLTTSKGSWETTWVSLPEVIVSAGLSGRCKPHQTFGEKWIPKEQ